MRYALIMGTTAAIAVSAYGAVDAMTGTAAGATGGTIVATSEPPGTDGGEGSEPTDPVPPPGRVIDDGGVVRPARTTVPGDRDPVDTDPDDAGRADVSEPGTAVEATAATETAPDVAVGAGPDALVSGSSGRTDPLPRTGADPSTVALAAAMVIVMGAAMSRAGTRRRHG